MQEEWREDVARKRTVSVIKLENEWSRGNIYCKSIFFLETAKQQKCENKGNLQTRHRNPKWTSTSVYQKQRTSFLIEHAGDWLRDSVGLIVLYHLPKLQNLPGMWQFPTGLLTSRCVQECVCLCVCIFKHVNLSLLCDHFFPPFFFFRVLRQRFLSWITEKWQMQMHTIKSPCVCVWRFLVCFIIFRIYQRRWHGHCCCQYCYWYNSLTNVIGIEWISINQLSSTISPVTSTMKQIASGIKQRKRTKRLRTKHAY